jgi:hypothetical protein
MGFVHIYYLHLFKANIADIIGEPKKTVSTPPCRGPTPPRVGVPAAPRWGSTLVSYTRQIHVSLGETMTSVEEAVRMVYWDGLG